MEFLKKFLNKITRTTISMSHKFLEELLTSTISAELLDIFILVGGRD